MCKRFIFFFLAFILLPGFFSCKKFLEADIDKSIIEENKVFSNDVTATSAMVGIYYDMASFGSSLGGAYVGLQALTGLGGSELKNYSQVPALLEYERYNITPSNVYNKGVWDMCYNFIYRTNDLLIGLEKATEIKPATKNQLKGEALFMRSFCYFYLINLYGDVPLTLNKDYNENKHLNRVSATTISNQIINDLKIAQDLLSDTYPTSTRTRPNKSTATALLARLYLYRGEWANAELQATTILNKPVYSLTGLNNVFLTNSSEAIWQLYGVVQQLNTVDGYYFIITSTPRFHILNPSLVSSFEPNDNRKTSWVGSYSSGGNTFYFPNKYKVMTKAATAPYSEFSTVFRLAEQFLIRAEARARQDKLSDAISDLDMVRNRAGLFKIANTNPTISKDNLLSAIEHERSVELFTEWGHRWFDLKRTGRSLATLGNGITQNDLLWPIPLTEFERNPNLGTQNPGY